MHTKQDTGYFCPNTEIKDYNVMIYGKNLFYQPVKENLRTLGKFQRSSTSQRDDYTTDCLLYNP